MGVRVPYWNALLSCSMCVAASLSVSTAQAADCDMATFAFWKGMGTPQVCDNHQALEIKAQQGSIEKSQPAASSPASEVVTGETYDPPAIDSQVTKAREPEPEIVLAPQNGASLPVLTPTDQAFLPAGEDNAPTLEKEFFIRALGGKGRFAAQGTSPSSDLTMAGLVAGLDLYSTDLFTLGLVGMYAHAEVEGNGEVNDIEVHLPKIGVQANFLWDNWHVTSLTLYGPEFTETNRIATVFGSPERLTSSYTNHRLTQVFEVGYSADFSGITVQPIAGIEFDWHHQASARESGSVNASSVAIQTQSSDSWMGQTSLGVVLSTSWEAGSTIITPRLGARWLHRFGDLAGTNKISLNQGATFTRSGNRVDENMLAIDAGLDFALKPDVTLSLGYSGAFSDNERLHAATLGLNWVF